MEIQEVTSAEFKVTDQRPDQKTRRYDRQLRLWAAAGQSALESAKVLVINGSATSSATLKNLVLPGVGHFTIMDHHTVTEADISNNFFLEPESIGKPRATEIVRLLLEMNDSVSGEGLVKNPYEVIETQPEYFTNFSAVMIHNPKSDLTSKLAELAWNNHFPLFVMKTTGFYASLRVQLPEQTIIDTHPDAIVDLRLNKPFKELTQFANSIDLEKATNNEYAHIPYIVLLIKELDIWKKTHTGTLPKNLSEKREFKKILDTRRRKGIDDQNFDEAQSQAYRAFQSNDIPPEIAALFNDNSLKNLSKNSSPFWFLIAALSEFTKRHGVLPHPGTLPDLHTDTQTYVNLQSIYKNKAREDVNELKEILKGIVDKFSIPIENFNDDIIASFAKHSGYLKVIKGSSIKDEYTSPNCELVYTPANGLKDEFIASAYAIYVAFLTSDAFRDQYDRNPGDCTLEEYENDKQKLSEELNRLSNELFGAQPSQVVIDAVEEVLRGGGGDLPNTAAFLGGLASQEIIKVITNQYVPIDNYCIIDLVKSTTTVIKV
ncbi:hypothetical protein E3Q01_02442 [Wallemia mellicola]|uniref:NEDD8-activating enzyme E1 regulatory subunit n=1 Tax=Wallemia mellicola TaxID=1708541 RepID=A0A4T0TJ59_9BASI|nr:hypothetical protein E3Q05_01727 [Wallemia mellicola]TIC64887.1 hypothetical protein E3Q01_02442 [Wallemia mellicola]